MVAGIVRYSGDMASADVNPLESLDTGSRAPQKH